MGGIVFIFVVSLSNEIAGSMLPVMYFPAMLISNPSSFELWFILFLVPIIGNFLGVYVAVSMNHADECDENTINDDIVFNSNEAHGKDFIYKL